LPIPSVNNFPGGTPVAKSTEVNSEGLLRVAPNYLWFYVVYPNHPGNWNAEIIEAGPGIEAKDVGTWFLPQLQKEPVIPGVNHNKTLKTGMRAEDAYLMAHMRIRQEGGIILPQDLGYSVKVDCMDPVTNKKGFAYMEVWAKPRRWLQGRRQEFEFDTNLYRAWRLSLIREGFIPEPDPYILNIRKAQFATRIDRREAQTDLDENRRSKLVAQAREAFKAWEDAKIPKIPTTPVAVATANANAQKVK
jgi:hypothetical protein